MDWLGDATPSYLWDFDGWSELGIHADMDSPRYTVADYIRALTPKVKVIIILRNPVDRLVQRDTWHCGSDL